MAPKKDPVEKKRKKDEDKSEKKKKKKKHKKQKKEKSGSSKAKKALKSLTLTDSQRAAAKKSPTQIVMMSGTTDFENTGVKLEGKSEMLLGPHKIAGLCGMRVISVHSGPAALHHAIIVAPGLVFTFGRNEAGQLGLGDNEPRRQPQLVDTISHSIMVNVGLGKKHTMFVAADGTVFASGENKCGQLGIGNLSSRNTPKQLVLPDHKIAKAACGADFSVLLTKDGKIMTCGHPEYGQLGNNTNGQYFISASKLTYDWRKKPQVVDVFCEKDEDGDGRMAPVGNVVIKQIACGVNHTVALDTKDRVYTWGFGGYGRLGHHGVKDEMVPRLIAMTGRKGYGMKKIAAGATCSLGTTTVGQLYFWGQTKSSGEATLFPNPEYDLNGWDVKIFAAGQKHIVVHSGSTVAWAPSPTYGELGYGEGVGKSSTKPKVVDPLDGIPVSALACGMANTLYVVPTQEKDVIVKLQDFPLYGEVPETCFECDGETDEDAVICDKCDRTVHLECTEPKLSAVPEGDFCCVDCR